MPTLGSPTSPTSASNFTSTFKFFLSPSSPFGGNGGHGADIIFKVDQGLHTLLDLRYQKILKGKKGENGRGKNQNGKGAEPLIVKVPQGTVVTDLETGLIIADLSKKDQEEIIAKGGRGGRGNTAFKTQTNTAPSIKPGKSATTKLRPSVALVTPRFGYKVVK